MKKVGLTPVVAMIFSLSPAVASAQITPEAGSIDGYMVNEYFNFARHHDSELEGRHGFWFRRIYFTYNNELSDKFKMRLRLEMNSTSNLFSSATLDPYVKDAYLDWSLGGGASLIAGIQSPPSFGQLESIWGWRPLEKTPLDLYKWTSSRDFGISIKGGGSITYHVMAANGSSNMSEADKGKKFFGAVGYKTGDFFVEGMAQYDRAQLGDDDLIGQIFGAYSGDWGRVGAHYSHRNYKKKDAGEGDPYNIMSVFAVIKAGKDLEIIGRWDYNFGNGYKTGFKGSGVAYVPFANNHEFNFFIAAFSWQAHKNVWIIPNIKCTAYKANDLVDAGLYEKPGNDVYTNLTLYFKY